MELEILEKAVQWGLGFVIALIVLFWKRGDDKNFLKEIKQFRREEREDKKMVLDVLKETYTTLQKLIDILGGKNE